jgi:hypothetical protein
METQLVGMGEARWSEAQDPTEWDDFVKKHHGSIFHLWAWKRVLESDGSRSLYLACRDESGKIVAVCPFFYKSGRRLLYLDSLPDSHTAGPILESTNRSGKILSSLSKSVKFSPFNPVIAMQIRTHRREIIEPLTKLRFPNETTHSLFVVNLTARPPEHIWNNGFKKHDRQAVKHYEQQGTQFGFARDDSDYSAYAELQKGSTIFFRSVVHSPERAEFLARMRAYAGDRVKVAIAKKDAQIIAGVSLLCEPENSTVHFAIVRYLRENNIHSRVTYLYWRAINWAADEGYRFVNLGSYSYAKSSLPDHPFSKLRERFEAEAVPRYQFVLPISRAYAIARKIGRVF